ncbi:MAG: AAA family ATPase [Chloroflexi bacterium]|nr:AAA family ATPase [Chloroflexota bacterium]
MTLEKYSTNNDFLSLCEGADCQGCDDCPQTPLSEIFNRPYAAPTWVEQYAEPSPAWFAHYERLYLLEVGENPNGHAADCECRECEQFRPEPAPVYYRDFDMAEWLNVADDDLLWHLPILAPSGLITLLSAGPKSGKTQLYWGLLSELQRFGTVLGDRVVPGLRVTVWTEERARTLKQKQADVKLDVIPNWRIVGVGDLENRNWELMVDGAISQWSETEPPDVLFIDTIGDWALNDDWNDYAKVIAVLDPLKRLATTFPRMAIVGVHHNRKAAGNAVDAASGSNALTGKVDNIVSLDKTDSCDDYTRRLRFMGRVQPDGMDGVDLYVRFDPSTGTYAKERKGKANEDAILDLLPDAPDGMTPKEVHEALTADDDGGKLTLGTVRNILRRLHAAGTITRNGTARLYVYALP